jgi:hypothetical protein
MVAPEVPKRSFVMRVKSVKRLAHSVVRFLKKRGHTVPLGVLLHALAAAGDQRSWHVALSSEQRSNAQTLAALRNVLRCLKNWVEIADEEDQRDYDYAAIEQAERILVRGGGSSQRGHRAQPSQNGALLRRDFAAPVRELLPAALLEAARLVVARWERGDLAEAVRLLDAAIEEAETLFCTCNLDAATGKNYGVDPECSTHGSKEDE